MSVLRQLGLILKRVSDVVFAVALLLLISPLLLVVAIAIKLNSAGPVFFRQERLGYRGRPFRIFKFRTMTVEAEQLTRGLPGNSASPHITRVGHYLRNYRID